MKPNKHDLAKACMLWNDHTSPTALRSDFEHNINRKAARKIWKWINHHFNFQFAVKEWSNGMLSPKD